MSGSGFARLVKLPRWVLALVASLCVVSASAAQTPLDITIGYLERVIPPPPVLSNLEDVPDDLGLSGTQLGIQDNATTGKFLKQTWQLETAHIAEGDDFLAAAKALLQKTPYIVVKAPMADLLALADLPEAKAALLFNASALDDALRDDQCRVNIVHTVPSRAMLTDALAQFAVVKRWTDWVLLGSTSDNDRALAAAYMRSATKFRVQVLAQKEWAFEADMRRNAGQEIPLFTQDLPDHHLMVVADEAHDYGRYVMYNTWLARPVAGSEGIVPSGWSGAVEQHGAAQLQSRFRDLSGRTMQDIDYAAWAAVRTVGEAATRVSSADPVAVRDYIFSDAFELGGFKGRPLSYRPWNGQLRQPIPISHPRAIIAIAPMDGFLHQRNPLDTLGIDEPESRCTAFKDG